MDFVLGGLLSRHLISSIEVHFALLYYRTGPHSSSYQTSQVGLFVPVLATISFVLIGGFLTHMASFEIPTCIIYHRRHLDLVGKAVVTAWPTTIQHAKKLISRLLSNLGTPLIHFVVLHSN